MSARSHTRWKHSELRAIVLKIFIRDQLPFLRGALKQVDDGKARRKNHRTGERYEQPFENFIIKCFALYDCFSVE